METVNDLIKAFREDVDDMVEDYLWSERMVLRFASGSLTAFAEKSMSIIDDGIEIDFSAGEDDVEFPGYIIDVLDAEIEIGQKAWSIPMCSPGELRRSQLPTRGKPALLLGDSSLGRMHIVPAPSAEGVLRLQAIRQPKAAVDKNTRLTDVPVQYREHLLLHMKHKAYSYPDAETFDAGKADNFLAQFNYQCQLAYEDSLRRRNGARRIRYPR